jgi:hypothetical protein
VGRLRQEAVVRGAEGEVHVLDVVVGAARYCVVILAARL